MQSVLLPESDGRWDISPLTVGQNYYFDDRQLLMENEIEQRLDNGDIKRFNTRFNNVSYWFRDYVFHNQIALSYLSIDPFEESLDRNLVQLIAKHILQQ